jgi:serine/threonine protein kinase
MLNDIGDFSFEQPLDFSGFSSIWRARHKVSGLPVSIRVIPKQSLPTSDSSSHFPNEISFFKQMDHPFILRFFQCIETDCAFHIITEYAEHGRMFDFLRSRGRITEAEARRFFAQLIQVLHYLHNFHQQNDYYIDWENILLDRYNNIRVIVCPFRENIEKPLNILSPAYAAPEIVRGGQFTTATDVWSAGILLYSILVGMPPFESDRPQLLWRKIVWSDVYFPWFLTIEAIDLLDQMTWKEPEQRISVKMIISHPWVSGEDVGWANSEIGNGDDNSPVDRIARRSRLTEQMRPSNSKTHTSKAGAQTQA